MLYSCTHMATVGVKGLTRNKQRCVMSSPCADEGGRPVLLVGIDTSLTPHSIDLMDE